MQPRSCELKSPDFSPKNKPENPKCLAKLTQLVVQAPKTLLAKKKNTKARKTMREQKKVSITNQNCGKVEKRAVIMALFGMENRGEGETL